VNSIGYVLDADKHLKKKTSYTNDLFL